MAHSNIASYFREKPESNKAIYIAIGLGIIGVISLANEAIILGIILLIIAAVLGWLNMPLKRPSDNEIDAIAASMMGDFKAHALEKLGLDEEQVSYVTPLSFWGYDFSKQLRDVAFSDLVFTTGQDGVGRSPVVRVSFFFFTEKEIHYFYKLFSLINGAFTEGTDVFYYKHVVSVKKQTEVKDNIRFDSFEICYSNGNKSSFAMRDATEIENSIKAMRALLSERQS